ncbi:MAG: glutathione S-transferase [Gammaproteobacteria bacterium]|nr:glutathione S-transferase [Gammaproteobacteria bacterium]
MADLRIFSYLPNPRIWKATITARLNGVTLDIRGAAPKELSDWLWDFDARPLSDVDRATSAYQRMPARGFGTPLYKTDEFLSLNPFGTVPCAFSGDGKVGIYESNSIMRAVARLGGAEPALYGRTPYESARIDSFLDASLVFARDSQIYLLASGSPDGITADIHARAADAFAVYMRGAEQSLAAGQGFIDGSGGLTLADICFVAEITLFARERKLGERVRELGLVPIDWSAYPAAVAHFEALAKHPAAAPDVGPYLESIKWGSY